MTPDQLKSFFDLNAVGIMFAFGMLYKYVPALGKLWNRLIPWINAAGYILFRVVAPSDAHAADGVAVAGGVGLIIGGLTNSFWAALIYDKLIKPLIEKYFGRHPQDIQHDKDRGLTVSVAKAKEPS